MLAHLASAHAGADTDSERLNYLSLRLSPLIAGSLTRHLARLTRWTRRAVHRARRAGIATPTPAPAGDATPHATRGRHLIVELHGCDPDRLSAAAPIRSAMLAAARGAGARVISDRFHAFGASAGISGVVLLAESHLSIHTWPEAGYAAADIYTCGRHVRPEVACGALAEALAAQWLTQTELRRGELSLAHIYSHEVLGTEHRLIHSPTGASSW